MSGKPWQTPICTNAGLEGSAPQACIPVSPRTHRRQCEPSRSAPGGAPFVVHEGLASSSARRLVVRSKRDNLPVNDGPPCRCCTPGHCLRDVTASAKTASRWRPGNFTNPPRVNRSIKADGTLAGVWGLCVSRSPAHSDTPQELGANTKSTVSLVCSPGRRLSALVQNAFSLTLLTTHLPARFSVHCPQTSSRSVLFTPDHAAGSSSQPQTLWNRPPTQ